MIIAECCTNWHDLAEAEEMIRVAHECGAGLVKFQLFDAEDDRGKPHYEWVRAHELTFDQAKEVFDYGTNIGQEVFFSVFGVEYVAWCEKIGVKRYKLARSVPDDVVMAVRRTRKPVITSLPVKRTFPTRWQYLYCPDGYPPRQIHMPDFDYEDVAGFSDHTIGLDAAKIALVRGAQIVEKHFVLQHCPEFPDDTWSMTSVDLHELVRWETVCCEIVV